MLSQVTPSLFLSGADAPLNAALMSQKGITLIVNATLNHVCPSYPGVECLRVPVCDLPTARLGDHFDHVADRIHDNRGGGTLVHCAAGMSRSPALVMAYLMRYRSVTLCQAHRWVQQSRPFVRLNAGFWQQLLEYEKRLYGRNTVRVAEEPPHTPSLSRATPSLTRAKATVVNDRGTSTFLRTPPSPTPLRAKFTKPTPDVTSHTRTAPPPPPRTAPPQRSGWLAQIPRSPLMSQSTLMMSPNRSRRRSKFAW